jgi:hypothetical protein
LTSDGGYILGGHTTSYGVANWDYYLVKVNSSGVEQWYKTFGQPRGYNANYIHDECYGVRQTPDGGYIMAGGSGDEYSYSGSGHSCGTSDEWMAYLVKTDSSGNLEWEDVYPCWADSGNSAAEYIALTSDGGYIVFVDTDVFWDTLGSEAFGFMKIEGDGVPDTDPPTPNPMTWDTVPYAIGESSIAMVATTASDISGVEYYFDEISGNPGGTDSGWQDSSGYTDTGLSAGTTYTYTVTARDKSSNQNETVASTAESATTDAPDTDPPTPDPMTFATVPYSTGETSIAMVATTATDASGVEYYFDETSGNPGGSDSGWQDSTSYTDSGLNAGTQYCYQVKARDKSPNQNETGWSTPPACATTEAPDTTPPTPDPMTWATFPYATGSSSIAMEAATASDPSGVEYYFTCTAGGGNDSGWQDSTSYEDTGLQPETEYFYSVKARDKSLNQNETGSSSEASATTDPAAVVDDYANNDIPVAGTVVGSYVDTQASDDVYEGITERESGGKPANRRSYLEHKWTINVTGGSAVTFNVEAYHTPNSEGDDFIFAYSTDDLSYTNMLSVTKTSDDDAVQSYIMPSSTAGTVYIRVVDTDSTKGNRSLDTIYVDEMYVTSEPSGGPCTPTDCHVQSVECGTASGDRGQKYGQVTVTIQDDCGNPVVGADVTGTFTGDYNETVTETTDGNGQAVLTTTTQVKKPSYQFCVDDVVASLPYDPADNLVDCCNY